MLNMAIKMNIFPIGKANIKTGVYLMLYTWTQFLKFQI